MSALATHPALRGRVEHVAWGALTLEVETVDSAHLQPRSAGDTGQSPIAGALIRVHVALVSQAQDRPRQTTRDAAPVAATQDAPEPSQAARQLHEYLRGERTRFDLALVERGTPFDRAVWHQLQQIPFGDTRSYGEIAAKLGRPGIARAVGLANGRNPFAIVVPCHRVIGKHGSLVGYAGGLEVKRMLLELESRQTTLPTLGASPRVDRGDADATASHAASSRGRDSTPLSRDSAFESAFQDADHGELRS